MGIEYGTNTIENRVDVLGLIQWVVVSVVPFGEVVAEVY
jgi:hypothetical protein